MLRAIWFLLRLGLLIAAVGWVMANPGEVRIDWQNYTIETSTQVLLFAVVFLIVIFMIFGRIYRAFISVPKSVRRWREAQARENAYLAITRGLAAVAAGDSGNAGRHARRAKKLLPEAPLTGLLTAQAALMSDDKKTARREFETLLDDENAAFFGIRGLMRLAAADNDQDRMIELMEHAETVAPKQPWIVLHLFENEARQGDWQKAEQSLSKAVRLGALDRTIGEKHRQALLLARGMEAEQQDLLHTALRLAKKSWRIDTSFIPAAVFYAQLLLQTNKQRSAIKTVEKTWRQQQHPDLQDLWLSMLPPLRKKNANEKDYAENRYYWVRRLYRLAPHGSLSCAMMGQAAIAAEKWEEARRLCKQAGDYRGLARLEILDGGDETKAREWLEMAVDLSAHPAWACISCGHAERHWAPLCRSCGSFNTAEWSSAHTGFGFDRMKPLPEPQNEDNIIAPPAAKSRNSVK
ncbi:MAG: hypothetical protein EA357_00575 [Micavibrio sp.]|nr:MAG: hypothetical protein EA357_00575 [Micavibrio sp.]